MSLIQNATNDWMKSWSFLPALYMKTSKVVCKKTTSELRFYNKLMLYEMRALQQAYAVQTGLR